MNPQTILLYDGSFDGFLCCVFMVYDQKIASPIIRKESETNNQLFTITETIITEVTKSNRVWNGLKHKIRFSEQKILFSAFLSEIKGVENTLLSYIKNIFNNQNPTTIDYSNKDILKISQVAKMVTREKHRMEAFVRFKLTKDNIYIATVEPDFNVLPLIIHHFKDRYADQKWLIYDIKRDYGIYYDLNTVEITTVDFFSKLNTSINNNSLKDNELDYQNLWNTYFTHINIKSRKNTKLHLQHLPKRYWKYLIEKNNI
ncbi:TIGR03915 family putative DNA repair protein [Aquimarina sp. 2201CG14-23]|uniref:TIGR03915 family putative DNA repair protein n=1 Tax=Aquimarina mycalae TaxID=3040073 RepID=UPI002477CFB5|nr:TIGR03915 family putative DNA repair protein [Aquimarina sp. 2201CG14-23]MDH7445284.1 TIGR03915 family putative DNA repair protein [Aquimarina sp. 2201CG14-23]